jgi:hypothetical protein
MKHLPPYYFSFSDFGIKRGPLINPAELARRALDSYNNYVRYGSEKFKETSLNYVDHLVSRFVFKDGFGVWPYYYLFERARLYGCRIPWVSALAQGHGISALLRAYGLTRNKEYLVITKNALKAFEIPMENGGVLSIDSDDGDWWYEEYASEFAKPSGVFNGFVIALLGAYDLFLFNGDRLAEQLFDRGISTLCRHMGDFDSKCPFKLSYYDRYEHTVSMQYHLFHIKLMGIMYEITKREVFLRYKQRWARYEEEWRAHRSYRWLSKIYQMKSGGNLTDYTTAFVKDLLKRKSSQ